MMGLGQQVIAVEPWQFPLVISLRYVDACDIPRRIAHSGTAIISRIGYPSQSEVCDD